MSTVLLCLFFSFCALNFAPANVALLQANVILNEDFELGTLDPRISLSTTGTFRSGPGIKTITNFGSVKAFGFGQSTCGANCFSNFVTVLRVTLPAATFISSVSFKEMELFENWGSGGSLFIDGVRLTDSDFGRLPYNDRRPDTTFRSKSFVINNSAKIIELRVEDITNLSEIYIDDLVITGTAPVAFQITSVSPNKGGNTGSVTTTIRGNGFQPGAVVRLREGSQVVVTGQNTIVALQTRIQATFDLRGQAKRVLTLEVVNPNGASISLSQGFTIEEGLAPQIWVDILGRGAIRPGQPQTFTVLVGNRGNVDAEGVPLWIAGVPGDATVAHNFQLTRPGQPPGRPLDWNTIPVFIRTNVDQRAGLFLERVPVAGISTFSFTVTVPNPRTFTLTSWVSPPFFGSPLKPEVTRCYLSILSELGNIIGLIPGTECAASALGALIQLLQTIVQGKDGSLSATWSLVDFLVWSAGYWTTCAFDLSPYGEVVDAIQIILGAGQLLQNCDGVLLQLRATALPVTTVVSYDPNDKIGAQGAGIARFTSGFEPLRFTVLFENKDIATAPAQEVFITDSLDTSTIELATVRLGPITIGNRQILPPPDVNEYTTVIDLRPAKNLLVKIEARLNASTGVLSWRFISLDPATGQPPDDPLAGFLPPNKKPPEGEGSVLFTVMPKNGLPTGTEIRNRARIIFDTNAPIDTPQWFNTLDNTKPTSRVTSLSSTQSTASFKVEWQGTDVGAGVRDYTIFVSTNGAPFTPWLSNTAMTSATFNGRPGNAYAFYSIAQDQTGNRENDKIVAEATTRVNPLAVASVSAASFKGPELAPESIVAAFGTGLATTTQSAASLPLPTALAGTTVRVRDSVGTERLAPLFFVSPSQVNYQVPKGTALGPATVTVSGSDGTVSIGTVRIAQVAPGLFAANADGRGAPVGYALRVKADGSQITEPIARFDTSQNRYVPVPINLSPQADQVFLILFGTGIRLRSSLSATTVSIAGSNADVLYAGSLENLVGLDQINLHLPHSLANRGIVEVLLTVDGQIANAVQINVGN